MSSDTVLFLLDVLRFRVFFGIGALSRSFKEDTLMIDSEPIVLLVTGSVTTAGVDTFGFKPDNKFSKSGEVCGPFISGLEMVVFELAL